MDRNLRIQVLFAGLDRLSAPIRRLQGGTKGLTKSLAETQRQLGGLKKAQVQLAQFKGAETRLRTMSAELERARAKTAAMRAEVAKVESPTKKMAAALKAAEKAEAEATRRHEEQGRRLQELSQRLGAAGVDVADLARHEDRLANEIDQTNRRLNQQREHLERIERVKARGAGIEKVGGRIGGAGAAATAALTLPALAAGVMSGRAFIAFESKMAEVRKVVTFDKPEQFAQMSDDILELSKRLPIAAEGLAEIVAAGGQSGIARDELLSFAESAAKLGIAFDISAGEAGKMMAQWRAAFGMGQSQVLELADRINYLGDVSAAEAPLISDIVTRVGPLGAVGGLAAGEIAALAATLGSMGIEAEIAGTGIKNVILALTKGEAATKAQGAAFQELGLDAVTLAKRMQKDAAGTIVDVMRRISKLDKSKQAGILTQIFGSESISAIAPLLTQLPVLEENLKRIGDRSAWSGSMLREFLNRNGTNGAKLTTQLNRLMAASIKVGAIIVPVFADIAEWGAKIADAFGKLDPETQKAIVTAIALVAVLGPVLTIVGKLTLGFGTLVRIVGPAFVRLKDGQKVAGPLSRAFMLLAKGVAWLGKALWGLAARFLPIALQAMWTFASGMARAGLMLLANPVVLAVVAIVAVVGLLAYAIYSNWDRIKAAFSAGVAALGRGWVMVKTGFVSAITWLAGLHMQFAQIGWNLLKGLVQGLLSGLGWVKDQIYNVGGKVVGWFKEKLGIKSPSRVFAGLGGHIMDGLAIGLDRGAEGPIARIRAVGDGLRKTMAASVLMAPAMASAATGGVAPASSRAPVTNHFHVSITVQGGGDARSQAREIHDELQRLARDAAERGYGEQD